MIRKDTCNVAVKGLNISVELIGEFRSNTRFSLLKKGGVIRYPFMSLKSKAALLSDFIDWAERSMTQSPQLVSRYQGRAYKDGSVITILGKYHYTIRRTTLSKIQRSIHDPFELLLPVDFQGEILSKSVSHWMSKTHQPEVRERLFLWNDKYFNKEVKTVSLRYTSSRWGSCSNKNNISLSSRLLLAPMEVLDYVIVHELSHLFEMNHSHKFWAHVARVMPDYKKHEIALKVEGPNWDY